ncbi:MFS transporter [Natrarchaeobius oligotrophus]|uniref:MFS transporter n=1 Tax=Natrarchaeobius chitinivorans TaxID=1679083 RepID=A0A3N6MH43_NATCH|nr:MFS transporter [Natrarchaeobius chitinivorans]RQH03339.1 MFS transporter [Natrarchaeobius chitinivorans]
MDGDERQIVTITMLAHAAVHVFELSIPVFIPIWLVEFGLTPAEIGLVVALGYGIYGIGALPGGVLADRRGSRRLILFSVVGMAASFVALSLARDPIVLALSLVLWGVAASVYHPAGLSLISTGVSRRGTALGYHGMAGNVGIALGPLATIVLLLFFDWRIVALALTIPAIVTIPVVLVSNPDESGAEDAADGDGEPDDVSLRRTLIDDTRTLFVGAFAFVFVLYVLEGLYYRGILTFLPELLAGFAVFEPVAVGDRSIDPDQYLYSGLLLVGVASQYAAGRISDRIRPERGVLVVFLSLAVLAVLYVPAVEAGPVPLIAVSVLLGLFLFGLQPFMQASVAEHSPPSVRGLSFGFVFAGIFGIGAAGAAVSGFVLTYSTPAVMFLVLAAFAALAVPVAYAVLDRY